ncbi:hypothetical protein OJF2_39860 [Aquisphaera giovannonii]|uniref:Uncharacterized protein n=1 Tax=Aquisphaera giovannonii TaxID=406548 RepID=A0A5B9W5F8_9BACT|nr:hypothetical protein [Aquisphaera giovannonii]QEH35434.1 hypothetical protein OJF2_39860 [Aquisphaera giovannonii]
MDEMTRRGLLHRTTGLGMLSAIAPEAAALGAEGGPEAEKGPALDRKCVLGSGMTEAEADCWKLAAELAGKFFDLPELHPMDKQEIATAIHVIQHRLLSRPTYRKYIELHKTLGPQK